MRRGLRRLATGTRTRPFSSAALQRSGEQSAGDTSVGAADPLLQPFRLKHLTLRNRVLSTSHAPSYVEDKMPQLRYRRYHAEKAKGGLALTMFGGSSTVSPDSPAAFGQIDVSSDAVIPHFQRLADAVHLHGAATMCQLTHMGRRTSWDVEDWLPTAAPSRAFRPPAPLEPLGAVRRWPPPVRLARSAAARHREGHPARSCARPQACRVLARTSACA